MIKREWGPDTRIALFVPDLCGGGAERVMVNLAIRFYELGLTIDLVLLKAEGAYLSEVPSGIRIVNLEASRLVTGLPKLVRYLYKEKPAVLLSAMKHANVIALLSAWLCRSKTSVIVSEHSTASVSISLNPGLKAQILTILMRWLYPKAKYLIAVSQGVADDLRYFLEFDKQSLKVIYNPIVGERLLEFAEQPVEFSWFDQKTIPIVIAVGRLTRAKDFEVLINAFSIVRKRKLVRLIILGEGELREELEEQIFRLDLTDDIVLPGFVNNPYAWMKRSDIFVLSSRWEGFGNVLVEAMACGTPVVCTDCPNGPAEILEDGKWGRLVPVGDENAIAMGIIDALENPKAASKERAMAFSVDKSVSDYLELILSQCGLTKK